MTMTLTIEELLLPASPDAPDAGDFRVLLDLNNRLCLLDSGIDGLGQTPTEYLTRLRSDADSTCHVLVAREASGIVGACVVDVATAEPTSAEVDLMVSPEHWG
ncbi:MAG: GNAT family N-acetyltransferase, partial [Microbacterium sp.]